MTWLRIFALVAGVRLAIEGLEIMFGEQAVRGFLVGVLIFVSGHILYQRWHRG